MNRIIQGMGVAALAAMSLSAPAPAQTAPAAAPAGTTAPVAVLATLRAAGGESTQVAITSYDGVKLFYRDPAQPAGASISVAAASLERFAFDVTLDEEDFNRALMDQNWNRACVLAWPVISPLLPYLGIKNNNMVDLTMTLGNSLVKTANQMRSTKGGDEEKANRITQRAYSVYAALGAAEWCPEAEAARLKAVLCLITLKNIKQADRDLKLLKTPENGDQTMGLYWYVLATMREANGNNREAMNAVVKSIAFENKDIEVFPDALMMSARLYEALLEPHRARDVYYEVVRLFPETDWARTAKTRLQSIMDQKLTQGKEILGIERTFFGLDEDVNAKAASLLKGTLDNDKPEAEGSMTDEVDTGKPDTEAKADEGEAPEAPPKMAAPPPAAKSAPAKAPASGTKTHGKTRGSGGNSN
ncbi:MAG: hypothetical protein WCG36_00615 [bacterium]